MNLAPNHPTLAEMIHPDANLEMLRDLLSAYAENGIIVHGVRALKHDTTDPDTGLTRIRAYEFWHTDERGIMGVLTIDRNGDVMSDSLVWKV